MTIDGLILNRNAITTDNPPLISMTIQHNKHNKLYDKPLATPSFAETLGIGPAYGIVSGHAIMGCFGQRLQQ